LRLREGKVAGVLMIIVGVYVGYHGWWEIQVPRGGPTEDPLSEAAAAVQQAVSNGVVTVGAGLLLPSLGCSESSE
jgi:hypothetical protein